MRRVVAGPVGLLLVCVAAAPAWAVAPDAPAQPSVTAGDAQIVVDLVAPADGGSPITGYTAGCISSDGGAPGSNSDNALSLAVTALTNGKTYTCTVTATNGDGTSGPSPASELVVPATVPDAPPTPTVARGDSQIVVTFTAPDDGGSVITSYSADCISSDGGDPGSNSDTTSPITVSALTNGKTYTCTVAATNALGPGAPSPASNAIVPATFPDAPPQPTVVKGNARIVVSFVAPNNGGDPITSYAADCTSSDGGAFGTHASAGSPNTVTGLTNGKTYTCTVTATNAIGSGTPSPASATVVPSTVSLAPTIGTVTRGNGSGSVAFTPSALDGGSPVTSFTASCTSTNGGVPSAASGAASPILVTGLTNGKTYTCRANATNANGTSTLSAPSAAFVPATVPSAPAIGAVESGNGFTAVSFTAGAPNGSAITEYTASCTSSDGGAAGSDSGTAAPVTVTGLTNGKIYSCTVAATNAVGTGAQSAASHTLVVGQPTAPSNTRVIPGNAPGATGPLRVLFGPAAANGSAITSYQASCNSTNGGVAGSQTGTASPITVAELTTGKTYLCSVVATNARATGFSSIAGKGVVGAPAAPVVLRSLPINNGVALPFSMAANNGSAVTNYRARCTSTNGGAPGSPLQAVSPIVSTSLTNGKTYTCAVTANNARGEGAPSVTAAFVAGPLPVTKLATCSGTTGTLTTTPGLLLKVQQLQTSTLTATYSCSGPYVSGGRISMSFRSYVPGMSCQKSLNVLNPGSGTFTWTGPPAMGKSGASARWFATSTAGHTTTLHYYGTVTSRSNVFTDAHISGNITLDKGLHAVAYGGDCSTTQPITSFRVKAISMSIS